MVGIYKITSPSGRIYIGQSWDIKKRWNNYLNKGCGRQMKLRYSFQKYGVKKHSFEIANELPSDISQDILNTYEIFYWQQYKDCGFEMMNIREPGSKGRISDESKLKMSDHRKKVITQNPEKNKAQLIKMADKRRGSKNTPEHTAKLIANLRTRKLSEATKNKISKSKVGKKLPPFTDEHKRKISESNKKRDSHWGTGKKYTPEHRAAISAGTKGKKKTHAKGWVNPRIGMKLNRIKPCTEERRAALRNGWIKRKEKTK